MTDKQIIIDGVDVSGCEHYDEVCLGNHHYKWCKDNDNCYYKQLKRKEQECEELKEARKNSRCAWKSLEGTFCPEAQEQLEAYKMEAEEGKEINTELKAENEELKGVVDENFLHALEEQDRADKYFKTLTEIKEIARVGAFYWKHYKEESKRYNEILQKISECEGNDEKR